MRCELVALAVEQCGPSRRTHRVVGHKQQNEMVGVVFDYGAVAETDLNPIDVMAIGEYAAGGVEPVGVYAAAEKRPRSTAGQALAISHVHPAGQRPAIVFGLKKERERLPLIPGPWTRRVDLGLPDRRVDRSMRARYPLTLKSNPRQ
jgi:hypothetical protein